MSPSLPQLPKLNHPDEAIQRLVGLLRPIATEKIAHQDVFDRVLAASLVADRPSPPLDVSAMDGFALRISDIQPGKITVSGVSQAGHRAPQMPTGCAVRIFTGAPVPSEADLVIKREDTIELTESFELRIPKDQLRVGQNIRRRGENGKQGDVILDSGTLVSTSAMVAVASFGARQIDAYRRLRVTIANTGDELVEPGESSEPWQIRDSNGPLLEALLCPNRWLKIVERIRLQDREESVRQYLTEALKQSDAILLTGGVSMGDTDHVPHVLRSIGCEIVFHKLPIRPGKPVLGAIGPQGQAILGLPGNPVSVAATAIRIALPVLRYLAGFRHIESKSSPVLLFNPDGKSIPLHWYRPVQCLQEQKDGSVVVQLTPNQGSGDIVALSRSDGFIEIAADQLTSPGPWKCYWLK
jgi:molybdopterin molybdotransferase